MELLPDTLLLEIFSLLPVKDRCVVGSVCKKFRRITCDNSLWRHVDLTPYRLNVRKTWKLIRSHLSECLLTFRIRGFLGKTGWKRKEFAVTNAMLDDLRERCPNIKKFHLCLVNIDELHASKLPKTITKLVVRECTWPLGWLKNAELPNLRILDVSDTRIIDSNKTEDFIKFSSLEEINLAYCYRINDKAVKMLAENLTNLKCLNLKDTSVTDLGIHHLCRGVPELLRLNIDYTKIEDGAMDTIATGLKKLEDLSIANCPRLSKDTYRPLKNLKSLKKLTIAVYEVSQSVLDEISIALPHCNICIQQMSNVESAECAEEMA